MRTWRRFVVLLFIVGTAFLAYRWWVKASSKAHRRRAPAHESQPDAG